jgi:hypothetical protein
VLLLPKVVKRKKRRKKSWMDGESRYRNTFARSFWILASALQFVLDQPPPAPRREDTANSTREPWSNTRELGRDEVKDATVRHRLPSTEVDFHVTAAEPLHGAVDYQVWQPSWD